MKYRKKPVVVDAFLWTGGPDQTEDPEWITNAIRSSRVVVYRDRLSIRTLEGVMQADVGDYIICGIRGEIYPCKPDIFAATYEQVASEPGNAAQDSDPADLKTKKREYTKLCPRCGGTKEVASGQLYGMIRCPDCNQDGMVAEEVTPGADAGRIVKTPSAESQDDAPGEPILDSPLGIPPGAETVRYVAMRKRDDAPIAPGDVKITLTPDYVKAMNETDPLSARIAELESANAELRKQLAKLEKNWQFWAVETDKRELDLRKQLAEAIKERDEWQSSRIEWGNKYVTIVNALKRLIEPNQEGE